MQGDYSRFLLFRTGEEKSMTLVPVFGWLHIIIGLVMLRIDLTIPMPVYWIVVEGVPISLAGLAIIWLYHKADLCSS